MNNGGPAFPCEIEPESAIYSNGELDRVYPAKNATGLTQLEWFAGKALPGVITGIMTMTENGQWHGWEPKDFADEAFKIAEAMLAESERRNAQG